MNMEETKQRVVELCQQYNIKIGFEHLNELCIIYLAGQRDQIQEEMKKLEKSNKAQEVA